ncbi:MAG: serine hydrolase [Bacteroidia bacterium]|nr:serine hydrolase [Bacteroidia bacterium]
MRIVPAFSSFFAVFVLLFAGFNSPGFLFAQADPAPFRPWFSDASAAGVDSLMQSLSPEEKIGQLVWRAWQAPESGPFTISDLVSSIQNWGLGGCLILTDDYGKLRQISSQLGSFGRIPLLKGAQSGAWGLPGTAEDPLPLPEMIGAVADLRQVSVWANDLAGKYQSAGIQFGLPEVLNLTTPTAKIAFQGDPGRISLFLDGLQEKGVFPIAGTTPAGTDGSLMTLSKRGLGGVITSDPGFSREVYLYQGLVVGDMRGKSENAGEWLASDKDVVLLNTDIATAISQIKETLKTGKLTWAQIDQKCRKVLMIKQLTAGTSSAARVSRRAYRPLLPAIQRAAGALTVLRNDAPVIPYQNLGENSFVSLVIGAAEENTFQQTLELYTDFEHRQLSWDASATRVAELKNYLEQKDRIVAGVFGGYDQISPAMKDLLEWLKTSGKSTLVFFTEISALDDFPGIESASSLVFAFHHSDISQSVAAQLLFGGIGARGRLPIDMGAFRQGEGLSTMGGLRFSYTVPEAVGLDGLKLRQKVEAVIDEGLDSLAFPGCQVLVAKNNQVIFHQAYGYHTYDKKQPVDLDDLYDLASVSKISGALPVLMQLVDSGKLDVDQPLKTYFPYFDRSDKGEMIIRDMLTHQAGLKASIVFWSPTLKKNGSFKRNTFSRDSSETFPIRTTEFYYLHKNYQQKMYKSIRKSPLDVNQGYVYSDLGFLLYPPVIQRLTGMEMETYLREKIYDPLGATRLTYNPWKKFPQADIVPTENDTFFRHQLVQGFVHDESAAMFGGVTGNAGLFSNANDLAKLMQMYLQMGEYGGSRYISTATMKEFSRYQFADRGNRRGLGFDKPLLADKEKGYCAIDASDSSFGHSGFTGTFTWADPENQLLIVVLSNRVHPTRANRKTYSLDIYQRVHQAIYEVIKEK